MTINKRGRWAAELAGATLTVTILAGCTGTGSADPTGPSPARSVGATAAATSGPAQPAPATTTSKARPVRAARRTTAGHASAGAAAPLPAGASVRRDVAYGPDPLQRLDVYSPAGAKDDPVILMVHGGGWRRGDKAAAGVVDNKVAHYLPAGYVLVSTDYRLYPAVTPTLEATDVATALADVQEHAAEWGGDGTRVVLMGHSAGANLVSLVAADPSYTTAAGASPPIGLVSLDSAAYDVTRIMRNPHLGLYDTAFGHDQSLWEAASPTLQVSGTPRPALLVCSSLRTDSCPQANGFADALTVHGGRADVSPVTLRHGQINSELGTPGALTDAVDAFLHTLGLPT